MRYVVLLLLALAACATVVIVWADPKPSCFSGEGAAEANQVLGCD